MTDPHFFGYGSLVNRATHGYPDARAARLSGWRRLWCHTPLRPVAYLTAEPAPGSEIDGLVARVPNSDWAALDLREAAYDRVNCPVTTDTAALDSVAVYTIPETRHGAPDRTHPILLSYLDVVVQGFAREFGTAGVARFFATTDGWDAPIRDDREKPEYPRHQRLSTAERALVDDHLAALGVRIFAI